MNDDSIGVLKMIFIMLRVIAVKVGDKAAFAICELNNATLWLISDLFEHRVATSTDVYQGLDFVALSHQ